MNFHYQSAAEDVCRVLFETTPVGIIVQHHDGRVVSANPAAERILGISLATLQERTPPEPPFRMIDDDGNTIPADQHPAVLALRTGREIPETTIGIFNPRRDSYCWVRAHAIPHFKEGESVPYQAHTTLEDITVERQTRRNRLELEAQLRQSQKLEALGTLAGGVAHEINNPINGIMNYAQLIQDRLRGQNQEVCEFAREICKETERVAEIVRNLLRFARQEQKGQTVESPASIVNDTMSLVRTIMRHDQIRIDMHVQEDLPCIQCRSQRLQQVLMNLMTNARDALNEKYPGYDENKRIFIKVRQLGDISTRRRIRITVEDYGAGIAENIQERVFDPFFTTKPRDKGSGLGLTISHKIVREHGGHLSFESVPGEYARFHIDLPVSATIADRESGKQS